MYGYELILDLHGCDSKHFNRGHIKEYFIHLCKLIKMKRCELHFWDDEGVPEKDKQTSPHTQGTSAVQFILTSSIVIHCLDQLGEVYINIFSCTEFEPEVAKNFSITWFEADRYITKFVERGSHDNIREVD